MKPAQINIYPAKAGGASLWKRLAAGLLAALVLVCLVPLEERAAAADEPEPERKKLVITVVEEIPAEEIPDNAVPLAPLPETASRSGWRHAALMGLALLAVIAYVWYFSRYERKLFLLRRQAVRAESAWMRRTREGEGRP